MNNDTKEQIIQVVLNMIGQEGVQQITVRGIAKRANVNIAAINYHFGSKENVIKQAMDFYTKTMASTFSLINQEGEPKEKLLCFLKKFADISITYPGVTKSFVSQMMFTEESDSMVLTSQKLGVSKIMNTLKQITHVEDEKTLKIMNLQLMSSILYPVLISKRIPDIYGFDYLDNDIRNQYIEQLYENIVESAKKNH